MMLMMTMFVCRPWYHTNSCDCMITLFVPTTTFLLLGATSGVECDFEFFQRQIDVLFDIVFGVERMHVGNEG